MSTQKFRWTVQTKGEVGDWSPKATHFNVFGTFPGDVAATEAQDTAFIQGSPIFANAPTLVAPASGADIYQTDANTFSWSVEDGQTSYSIRRADPAIGEYEMFEPDMPTDADLHDRSVRYNNDRSLLAVGINGSVTPRVFETTGMTQVGPNFSGAQDSGGWDFSPDGSLFAYVNKSHPDLEADYPHFKAYNTVDWTLANEQNFPEFGYYGYPRSLTFSPDGTKIFFTASGSQSYSGPNCFLVDTSTWSVTHPNIPAGYSSTFMYSPDGSQLFLVDNVTVYNTSTWGIVRDLESDLPHHTAYSASYNNDGSLLAITMDDAELFVFETSGWTLVDTGLSFNPAGTANDQIVNVIFSPDGAYLIAVMNQADHFGDHIYVYSTTDWSLVAEPLGPIFYRPISSQFWGNRYDGTAKLEFVENNVMQVYITSPVANRFEINLASTSPGWYYWNGSGWQRKSGVMIPSTTPQVEFPPNTWPAT